MLFITHYMGVVAEIAGHVLVMRNGRKVEDAPGNDFFDAPQKAYSRELLAAVPRIGAMKGIEFPRGGDAQNHSTPLIEVQNLVTRFPIHRGVLSRHVANVHAVDDVSFSIDSGETPWSGNRRAGNRPPAGPFCGLSSRNREAWNWRVTIFLRLTPSGCAPAGVKCRSSSRTLTPRSIRA